MPQFIAVELHGNIIKNAGYVTSYTWEKYLKDLRIREAEMDGKSLDRAAVPLTSFKEHVLREFMEHITGTPNLLVYCKHKDYKKMVHAAVDLFWFAQIKKVVGYRALMRWVGSLAEDVEHDFWINLASFDVRGVGSINEDQEFVVPPRFLEERWIKEEKFADKIAKCILEVSKFSTISDSFIEYREKVAHGSCKLHVGQRLELLDYQVSSRVRPARIKAICGRRIWVQVLKIDCNTAEEEDKQYGPNSEFWVDQASFYLFPVGWACLNNYDLEAKSDYKRHAQLIADAIQSNTEPQYSAIDVRREQLVEWKEIPNCGTTWQKGMKFELLDPLGTTLQDLYVATVLDILKDGYLKVGMDGPEMEEECLPLHCTSPLLFPVGYAEKYELILHGPEEEDTFKWPDYLKKCKAKAAPKEFFKKEPSEEILAAFKPGAKLEAADMCENTLVCPGTIVGIKGRLLMVHYDGWESEYDAYFDIDSKDIFPLGWCEIHGYKLEHPKVVEVEEPSKKKRR